MNQLIRVINKKVIKINDEENLDYSLSRSNIEPHYSLLTSQNEENIIPDIHIIK